MSDLPTFAQHALRDIRGYRDDPYPYEFRLTRALGRPADRPNMWTDLTYTALNFVRAQQRLLVVAARVPAASKQELDAQAADVSAWRARADAIACNRSEAVEFYGRAVTALTGMELESQRLDDDARNHWELGMAGRIHEIVTEPEPHVYNYDAY